MRVPVLIVVVAAGCLQPSGQGYYVPASTTPPQVLFTRPTDGQTNVPITVTFEVAFSEAMDPVSTRAAVQLVQDDGGTVPYTAVEIDDAGTGADGGVPVGEIFQGAPINPLQRAAPYTLTVSHTATDVYGNALPADVFVRFQTEP